MCGCSILYEAEYDVKKIKASTPRKLREDKQGGKKNLKKVNLEIL
jgi:hypothetical protein